MGKVYLTTTLPYVNDRPHIGFALEIVQADALARFRRLLGDDVFFNFGTDEHGQKIYRKALEEGKDPKAYVDEYAATFQDLKKALNLSYDAFIRTTDSAHKAAAQEFWKRCAAAGDIYKKAYKIKYCVGCELEKTDSELVGGRCPLHPNLEIELIDEENYFFRLSKYQEKLLELYDKNPDFVVPAFRLNEIRSLIAGEGLQDFSISRLKSKLPWGVPVPDDSEQVMYVWFDALINYISTLGWPKDEKKFNEFWGTAEKPNAIQFAGKDQVRQQAVMWQAMLMSAGLPTTKQIFIHGFISVNGQKMSKSLGNVIYPVEFAEKYGTDAVRYFLLRHIHPFEDSDFSEERFREAYDANLANGLGNLVARVMKLAEDNLPEPITAPPVAVPAEFKAAFQSFEFNKAMDIIWKKMQELDQRIASEEPYKLVKTDPEKGKELIAELVSELYHIMRLLHPVMPSTHASVKASILANKKPETLFPRLD
ncbi:MAG: methionine--tRNA ligase [bacterium]|nr:methionine--tRNA ligase [bacterium]